MSMCKSNVLYSDPCVVGWRHVIGSF